MTRSTEAFEDVIEQLVGALTHAGQALDSAATAVQLMSSAKSEENLAPASTTPQASHGTKFLVVARLRACVYGRRPGKSRDSGKTVCQLRKQEDDQWLWTSRPYTNAALSLRDARRTAELYGWQIVYEDTSVSHLRPEAVTDRLDVATEDQVDTTQDGPFQRGFAAGKSVQLSFLNKLARHLTESSQGNKWQQREALLAIAGMVEGELGLAPSTLRPYRYAPEPSDEVRKLLDEMRTVLVLARQGKIELNTGAQKVAARLEKALGLAEGAIWPENLKAPNSPDAMLVEHVRRHEQLLARLVVEMGKRADKNVQELFKYICDEYTQLGLPERIDVMTFRHLDTRDAFIKLGASTP